MKNKSALIVIVILILAIIVGAVIILNYPTKDWQIKADGVKNYCTQEQKKAEVCTMEYHAVCGWFNENIQCFKYPCAATYSNPCMACSDEKVAYWTEGECP